MMKVSIITIVYNNRAFIDGCIRSVLSQTYPNIEHIVIDGGSTDGTQELIEAYRDQISHYQSGKDRGLYDALNKGIERASGDVVGLLHSDDLFYEPDTIQKVVNAFQASSADLVYANGIYVDKEDVDKVKRIYPACAFRNAYLYFGWVPLHTTIYVKKELFEQYGLYDRAFSIAGDYDISLRWFKQTNISKYYLRAWVVKMRLGGKSTSVNFQRQKSMEDLIVIRRHQLLGWFTLFCKIVRKLPQYLLPYILRLNIKWCMLVLGIRFYLLVPILNVLII